MKAPLSLLSICWLLPLAAAAADSRPNIIFIFTDDHALRAISAYGDALNETPQIDRIANEGMLFERSYVTNSICGPSRASVLTGMHSHRNGFLRNQGQPPFDSAQTTLQKLMQQAGYQTTLLGKWHLHSTPTGFDHFKILPGQGHYYNPDFILMDGSRTRVEGYATDIVTDLALDWMENGRDRDKPFLLKIQHKAPHRTFTPPLHLLNAYEEGSFPEHPTLFDDYANRSVTLKDNEMEIARHFRWHYDLKVRDFNPDDTLNSPCPEYARMTPEQQAAWDAHFEPLNDKLKEDYAAGRITGKDLTRWKYQRYLANFMGTIASVDENVGRVLDYLDETGLAENTVVVYSSDQGFYLGEHGWYDKRWMFEESFAMPFIIRWPGEIEPGSREQRLIQNIDYAPTFLEMADAEIPERMQGRSLVPLLRGKEDVEWRDALYYTYYDFGEHAVPPHDGVADGRFKLIRFPTTDEWNLMDLEEDPFELRSFHDASSHRDTMERMLDLYHEMRAYYQSSQSAVPVSGPGQEWMQAHNRMRDEARQRGSEAGIVLLGDDTLARWAEREPDFWESHIAPHNPLNFGHPNELTEHTLWRIKGGVWPEAVQPNVALIGLGAANCAAERPAEETVEAIQLLVEDIIDRSPETKVILLPAEGESDAHDGVNRGLASLAAEREDTAFTGDVPSEDRPARLAEWLKAAGL